MWVGIIWQRTTSRGAWAGILVGATLFLVTGQILAWQKGPQLLLSLCAAFATIGYLPEWRYSGANFNTLAAHL
ncbi:MAG: hypothetical protein EBZ50_13370, partial [Alphaproteobacteria bacterium]|nr:hypothetical protein [Alphaproteobacteria bacterium]